MKRTALLIPILLVAACRPYQKEQFTEVAPNETAFVIPLETEGDKGQAKFDSVKYLETRKIAAKRIPYGTRWRQLGRAWWDGEWIPQARVVKVDRTPVTREWTKDKGTGTNAGNQTIGVESVESIGFSVDLTLTATIREEDAALFLYWYSGKPLSEIVDSNLRSAVAAELSTRFGSLTLDECRKKKGELMAEVGAKMTKEFAQRGITILTFGNIGGLQYEDQKIQDSINEQFKTENALKIAQNKLEAEKIENQRKLSIAENERHIAEEFSKAGVAGAQLRRLEIAKTQAEKWNGELPRYLVTSGSGGPGMFLNMAMPEDPVEKK